MGRVTRDPELRSTPKGTAVAELGLAANRVWIDENGQRQEETTFVDIILWGRTAEIAQQYLRKGSPPFIEGRLQTDTWEQNGQQRSRLHVVAENLQLIGERQTAKLPPAPTPRPTAASAANVRPSHPAPVIEPDFDAGPF